MGRLRRNWLQLLTHLAALLPLAILVWSFAQDSLSVNPIQEITLRTGIYSLVLLLLSLACTPLSTIFGLKLVLPLRRPLGLYGFMYGGLHFLNFIGFDYRFDLNLLRDDVFGKAYIWVGLAALLVLVPVTVTSTRGWVTRLGGNWVRLHWLVYPAAGLSVAHFLLLVKVDAREPRLYALVVLFLLLVRLRVVRNLAARLRHRLGRGGELRP